MIKKRPRQIILDGLEQSKELYIKLQYVIQSDPNLSSGLKEKLKDIEVLKERIRRMPLSEFEQLLNDAS